MPVTVIYIYSCRSQSRCRNFGADNVFKIKSVVAMKQLIKGNNKKGIK